MPFIFATSQIGSERFLKNEFSSLVPECRFSYSRAGFLTFKTDTPSESIAHIRENSVFTRSVSESLGKIIGKSDDEMVAQTWTLLDSLGLVRKIRRIHAWIRDPFPVGEHGFEPGTSKRSVEIHSALLAGFHENFRPAPGCAGFDFPAFEGENVLDCIEVAPGEWWIGRHKVVSSSYQSRFPGGMIPLKLPEDAVSRAWLKFEEALRWSALPIGPCSRCADIGASPGGGSQALLARGAEVLGVDPAEMHPKLLAHPNFTHLRGRIGQLKRKLFRDTRWVVTDMNVAPGFTLEVLEELIFRYDTNIRGLIFTLKLPDIDLVAKIPEYFERIRTWGYRNVRIRQLQFNRREITVALGKYSGK